MRALVATLLASLVPPTAAPPTLPAPTASAQLPGLPCSVSATFRLQRTTKTMSYGACVQVLHRTRGRNVWFTISGSCLSTGPTTTDPAEIRTARTAYLGHDYRVMAKTTVTQGNATRSATAYSAAAAP